MNTTNTPPVATVRETITFPDASKLSVLFKSESDAIRALCLKVFGAEPSYETADRLSSKPGLGIMVDDLRKQKAALVQRNIELQDIITAQKKEIAALKANTQSIAAENPTMRELPWGDLPSPPPLPEGKTRWVNRGTFKNLEIPAGNREVWWLNFGDWNTTGYFSDLSYHIEAV